MNSGLESQLFSKLHKIPDLKSQKDLKSIQLLQESTNLCENSEFLSTQTKILNFQITTDNLSIKNLSNFEEKIKLSIIAEEPVFLNEKTIQIFEKNGTQIFEFENVAKPENMCDEIQEVIQNIKKGGNGCIINFSIAKKEHILLDLLKKFIKSFSFQKATLSCVEMIGESLKSLLPDNSLNLEVLIDFELLKVFSECLQRVSKGNNFVLLALQMKDSFLQILDVSFINKDHSLSEGLSLNSSFLYLEELLINVSNKLPFDFDVSILTKELFLSISSNCYICVFFHCENTLNSEILALATRIQPFQTPGQKSKEITKTLENLKKERNHKNKILRIIEKTKKDIQVYSESILKKDLKIAKLTKSLKNSKSASKLSVKPPKHPKIFLKSPKTE